MYEELTSQLKIKNYTKNILNNMEICNDIKNKYPEYYNYFTTFLFTRHPNYPERFNNMVNIGIKYNDISSKYKEIYIINENNETDTISVLNKCITGKPANNLTNALRNTIIDQILDFKFSQKNIICELCNSTENIEVDHKTPLFSELTKEYIKQCTLEIPKEFDSNNFNGKIFKKEDTNFKNEWYLYHKNNATLRLLCRKCNLARNKKT